MTKNKTVENPPNQNANYEILSQRSKITSDLNQVGQMNQQHPYTVEEEETEQEALEVEEIEVANDHMRNKERRKNNDQQLRARIRANTSNLDNDNVEHVEFDDMLQFEPRENMQDANNMTNIILEALSPNQIPSGQSSSQSNSNVRSSG